MICSGICCPTSSPTKIKAVSSFLPVSTVLFRIALKKSPGGRRSS